MKRKIQHFKDMLVWQKGYELTIEIYKITKKFPSDERFSLIDQLRRSSVSITSNIAEGFGRFTPSDKSHFYTMSLGSLYELESQLYVAYGLGYIDKNKHIELLDKCTEIGKMLSVVIKKIKSLS